MHILTYSRLAKFLSIQKGIITLNDMHINLICRQWREKLKFAYACKKRAAKLQSLKI